MKQYFLGVLTALVVTLGTQALSQDGYTTSPGFFSENAQYIVGELQGLNPVWTDMMKRIQELEDHAIQLVDIKQDLKDIEDGVIAVSVKVDDHEERVTALEP